MINLNNIEEKNGALAALEMILDSKHQPIKAIAGNGSNGDKESLLKMPKNTETVAIEDDDETPEEKEERLQQQVNDADPQVIAKDLQAMQRETKKADVIKNKNEEKRALWAHEDELRDRQKNINKSKDKLSAAGKHHLDYRWFYKDLENAINHQIDETNDWEDTYDAFNATYADSDLLMPGERRTEKGQKPIISVYFDCSGSISSEEIANAIKSLSFLDELESNGDIEEYNTYYFANSIHNNPSDAFMEGGTHAFPKILEHVKQTQADNVIIYTDDDFDVQSGNINALQYVKIDGCMWWLWSEGLTAKKAWPHLVSSDPTATYHYDIK